MIGVYRNLDKDREASEEPRYFEEIIIIPESSITLRCP
jgi:hypothetical protein